MSLHHAPLGAPPPGAVHVVAAALIEGGRCLVALRAPEMSSPNCWELPGGKVHPGEHPHDALAREIHEELGLIVAALAPLGRGVVPIGARTICLDAYLVTRVGGSLEAREHAEVRWISPDEIDQLEWAPGDVPLLGELRKVLGVGGWGLGSDPNP